MQNGDAANGDAAPNGGMANGNGTAADAPTKMDVDDAAAPVVDGELAVAAKPAETPPEVVTPKVEVA